MNCIRVGTVIGFSIDEDDLSSVLMQNPTYYDDDEGEFPEMLAQTIGCNVRRHVVFGGDETCVSFIFTPFGPSVFGEYGHVTVEYKEILDADVAACVGVRDKLRLLGFDIEEKPVIMTYFDIEY